MSFLDPSSGTVRLLSIDLSKAFDKLDHGVIIRACIDFNMPNHTVNLIRNFLFMRKQRVFINGTYSSYMCLPSGVPQGSVLGPILFALATDKLTPVCSNSSIIKYADDILLLHFVRSPIDDNLQDEWTNIVQWADSVSLSINFSKCNVLDIITKASLETKRIRVSDDCHIGSVESLSFLGVTFSNNLKWSRHFDLITQKVTKRVYIIRNLRRAGCNSKLMIRCYNAFLRSLLLYAYPCFCNAPQFLLTKLLRLERRVFRIIGTPCHNSLIVTAEKTCRKLYLQIKSDDSHPLREMFVYRPRGELSTRSFNSLLPPFAKTKRYSNSFIKYCR